MELTTGLGRRRAECSAHFVSHLVQRSNRQDRAEGCSCQLGMERLPVQHQPVLLEAQQAYLGQGMDCLASRADQLTAFIYFVKHEAASRSAPRQ